ncbi:MFS transporter [Streptosporangium sandarakinum]|uniref:MFS family permease n=1 Tax=Streptosporangium sandarakinum TaxID=1260955 RepID=A0A852V4W6_9ACTN|nr:MFS transporter [Streptosporangium sandarakinum]NYF43140.1 MFS family permease [Streptosporangium sandarakinum]
MGNGWNRARRVVGEASRRTGRAAAGAGRGTVRAGRGAGRAVARAGRGTAGGVRRMGRATRRLTHAQGAGRTGLGPLIELTAGQSAGDALVTAALAGTLFKLPVNEARGHVALYLLITMIPFVVVAPFVGPVLDRFRSGRRFVMAGTLFGRGLLCFAMAAAFVSGDPFTIFPAALAVLVLSKAYSVSRAAIMPNVLPADIPLVTANARVALFALVAAGVAVPIGAGVSAWVGGDWMLRGATVVFLLQGVWAVRLPRHVDSPDLEELREEGEERPHRWRTLLNVGPVVTEAMRANMAIRAQSGFLLFYLLFLVQDGKLPGQAPAVTIGLLAVAAGAGGLAGTAVASRMRRRSPQVIVLATLALTTVATIVPAVVFTLWTAVAVALVAAFAQGLGKLALDAIVQREIGEEVRSSTFGVVEAILQITWVAGGLFGLLLSLFAGGRTGLAVMAALLGGSFGWLVARRRGRTMAVEERVQAARSASGAPAASGVPAVTTVAGDDAPGSEGPAAPPAPDGDPQGPPPGGPSPDGPVPGGSTSGGPEGGPYDGSPASGTRRLRWTRRAPKPTGPTTAIVRHGDHPADKTEKHTKPLTNPHG